VKTGSHWAFRSYAELKGGPVQRNSYEVPRRAASPIVWAETAVGLFGVHTSEGEILLTSTVYRTPHIRINWDGEPFEYAEIPVNYIFPLENSAKIVSFKSICYYVQYVQGGSNMTGTE